VVERRGGEFRGVASGVHPAGARATTIAERLARLHAECLALVVAWKPDAVVLERNFVAHKRAERVPHRRGCAA